MTHGAEGHFAKFEPCKIIHIHNLTKEDELNSKGILLAEHYQ